MYVLQILLPVNSRLANRNGYYEGTIIFTLKVLKENFSNLDHFVLENDPKYLLFLDIETY